MHPVRAARFQAVEVCRGGEHRKHHEALGEAHVVDHAAVGRVEELFRLQFALLVDDEIAHRLRTQARGFIPEREHLARHRVHAHVRSHRFGLELALVVPGTIRLERVRVHAVRATIFLGGQQVAAMEHRRGVRHGPVDSRHGRVVGERIAVAPEQAAARFLLGVVTRGVDVADIVVDRRGAVRPFAEQKPRQHAICGQQRVPGRHGRVGRIRHGAEEGTANIRRNDALHREIPQAGFRANGRIQPAELDFVGETRLRHGAVLVGNRNHTICDDVRAAVK